MTIKQQGGVFGRNPSFNDVEANSAVIDGTLTADKVGVNVVSPSDELHVAAGAHPRIRIDAQNTGQSPNLLFINSADGLYAQIESQGTNLVFKYQATEGFRLNGSGNLAFPSGKGIDFSATAGTGTSELFDDYEEGTWTPQYTNTTPPTTPYTMDIVSADYVKIGSTVIVTANIRTDNVDTTGALGALRVSGLPFTCGASAAAVFVGSAVNWAGDFPSSGYVNPSSTQIILRYRTAANGVTSESNAADLTTGAVANQNVLLFSAIYTV